MNDYNSGPWVPCIKPASGTSARPQSQKTRNFGGPGSRALQKESQPPCALIGLVQDLGLLKMKREVKSIWGLGFRV